MAKTTIYGVTVFMNDVNFSLKNREKQVLPRMSYQAFFTRKKAALTAYKYQLNRFNNEKGICYKGYSQRGRCEVYVASIMDNSQLAEHGKTILKKRNQLTMYTKVKILFIITFLFCCGYLSKTEFQDMRKDNSIRARQESQEVIDDNQDGQHDSTCHCGYCEECGFNECDTLIADETWIVGDDTQNLVFTYNDKSRQDFSKLGTIVDDFYNMDSSEHCTWDALPNWIDARKLITK